MNSVLRILLPLGLGLAAGVLNYLALRGANAPIELVSVREDTKSGTEIKSYPALQKVSVRGDAPTLFKSVVPWSERGVVLNRRVNRPLVAGELVLFADIRSDGPEDIQSQLKPGETSFTFTVKQSRLAPGLRVGDLAGVLVTGRVPEEGAAERPGGGRVVGPVRIVGLGDRPDPFRAAAGADDYRKVSVAVPLQPDGTLPPAGQALEAAAGAGDERRGKQTGVLAVEFYRPPAG